MTKAKEQPAAAAAAQSDDIADIDCTVNGATTATSAMLALIEKTKVKLKTQDVDFDGIKLVVHEMARGPRLSYLALLNDAPSNDEEAAARYFTAQLFRMQGELIFRTVTDANGVKLLSRPEDIELLGQVHPDWVETLYSIAWELNGLNRKKAEVDAEKNLETIPT